MKTIIVAVVAFWVGLLFGWISCAVLSVNSSDRERRGGTGLDGYTKIVIETDEKNPVHIATVTAEETDIAAGYRARITPRYD